MYNITSVDHEYGADAFCKEKVTAPLHFCNPCDIINFALSLCQEGRFCNTVGSYPGRGEGNLIAK